MSQSYFTLNSEKVHETILYVACRLKYATLHTVFKIMYFADKLHLSEYGRFISGDTYVAMEYGPVPSKAYDITKDARDFDTRNGIVVKGYHIFAQRDANIALFSESDTDCLDRTIAEYGKMTFGQLTDASHDKAWMQAPENGEMTIESIVMTMDDSEDLLAHLQDQYP